MHRLKSTWRAISPVCIQFNAFLGTGRPDQINEITRSVEGRGLLHMSLDVVNESLIPSLLETANEVNVGAPIVTKGISLATPISMPTPFDLRALSTIKNASGSHITNFLGATHKSYNGKTTAVKTSTIPLGVSEHRVDWLVMTVNRDTGVDQAVSQSALLV